MNYIADNLKSGFRITNPEELKIQVKNGLLFTKWIEILRTLKELKNNNI